MHIKIYKQHKDTCNMIMNYIGTRQPWIDITGSLDTPPHPLPFVGPSSPVIQAEDPIDFYRKLMDDMVVKLIVDETNR